MEKTLKKSRKLCILSFLIIIFILNILFPTPILAFEKVFRNSLGMEFVLIPAGTFTMGSPENEPNRDAAGREVQHKVTISRSFYMQTTEVTLKQWRTLMGKKLFGKQKGTDDMPVIKVSWYDCMKFIKKLNALNDGVYRLPTEAEWEYACRAGSKTAYSWGDEIGCSKAMYSNNTRRSDDCILFVQSMKLKNNQPAPVKTYPPNAWGLYDMHGNVWEWCQDLYGDYSANAITDPLGPDSGTMRIRRGGSWFFHDYKCRSANRAYAHPASRFRNIGFRLVRMESSE